MAGPTGLPNPLGFPNCPRCAYRNVGTPAVCHPCASRTLPPLAQHRCPICSQSLDAAESTCRNKVCALPASGRRFTRVDAIAMYSAPLKSVLTGFKYDGYGAWAAIFGRLIVGWLDDHREASSDIDLILGNPTAPDREPYQHVELMMQAAYDEDTMGAWPFDLPHHPTLVKLHATERSAGGGWDDKLVAARSHTSALELRGSVADKTVLLVDDLFTTGAQLNEVAQLLQSAGAAEVRGLVLARAPWSP